MARIITTIFLFFAVFFLPWWLTAFFACVAFFVFTDFYEVLFLGLLSDLLYGAPVTFLYGFSFVATVSALVMCISGGFLKTRMRIYENP